MYNKIINVVFVEINETYQNDDGVYRQLYWMSFEKFIKKYESFVVTTEFLLGFEPWKLKFFIDFPHYKSRFLSNQIKKRLMLKKQF